MKLIIIAALNHKRVIGKDGSLPWHLSEDLKRIKRLTTGHTILMGRRTFESLGKPLPNRRNVVLTSRPLSGIETYKTIPEALEALKDEEKVFVFGGGNIFGQLLEACSSRGDIWSITPLWTTTLTAIRSSLRMNILSETVFSWWEKKNTTGFGFWTTARWDDRYRTI